MTLSQSAAGRALHTYFGETYLGIFPRNRLCRGVLVIPTRHTDYLRGRRRQALRTNLRRAEKAGIRCERVVEPRCFITATWQVMARRQIPATDAELEHLEHVWPALVARAEMTLLVARDRGGLPQAVLAALVDDDIGLIQIAVASSHEARWALHDHLVQVLSAREATFLLVEGGGPFGALGFPADIHHYQHLLGYELRHLRPAPEPAV